MGITTAQVFSGLTGQDLGILFSALPTPCYVIDEEQLERNGARLSALAKHTGCKVLLAQKAFSNFDFYPLLEGCLAGTAASGLYEARLGKEEMGDREVHVFCAAYREDNFEELLDYADHIVFNSPNQLRRFGGKAKRRGKSVGLRINPECSTQEGHSIYDPCGPGSRLGTTRGLWGREMTEELICLLDGLHFHTLCEQNADDLARTLQAVEERFREFLPRIKWLNMGGGHHITQSGYDLEDLEKTIAYAQSTWGVEVYLEPGEAVALNAGYLVSRVLDVIENGSVQIAVLDTSAACHMPDVLEMPYQPPVYCASTDPSGGYPYRLAGPTCLAGDVIGEYHFPQRLKEGDMVLFGDMAIYTTCKNNTFNGMPLPDIWKLDKEKQLVRLTKFGYEDFKRRLGKDI
ncbi:carboxynorspermidine decarboxylase [Oscillibacter sp.]|uniref:carboxynorspermidine decarboxylase n=1 Tax=Oscillibacter sp. TaxID=1945593 RepID=UPI002899A8C9|nr:carboxynorspermidine decarboxylase [Oscillibacter sp.]